ncbi:MAG TPA: MerR family transcriptional regulator [Candidatus Dormibacteraeota bacterium]
MRSVTPPSSPANRPGATTSAVQMLNLDKPLYTIGITAEILATHTRTLMMYEHLGLVVPSRTATNRRLYSQRDIITLGAIQRLTRGYGLNLISARFVILCLQLLDANAIPRPGELADIDVTHVKV